MQRAEVSYDMEAIQCPPTKPLTPRFWKKCRHSNRSELCPSAISATTTIRLVSTGAKTAELGLSRRLVQPYRIPGDKLGAPESDSLETQVFH